MKKFRNLVAFVLCISLLGTSMNVMARTNSSKKKTDNSELIAREYVMESFDEIISSLLENETFKSRVTDKSTFILGEAYIVYRADMECQDKVFYFPIVDKWTEKIVYLIETIGVDGTYVCNTLDGIVEVLNEVDYLNNECIVYYVEENMYVETPSKIINVCEFYNEENDSTYCSCIEDEFFGNSFKEKKNAVYYRKNELVDYQKHEGKNNAEKKLYGSLTLVKPQGQYAYGMCWAAAVATVHNYFEYSVITGFEVCTRMGIGYDTGGTIYDMQDALALYNITYNKVRKRILTWDELTNNIDKGYPIIIGGYSSVNVGHAVTIYGYSGSASSTSNILIWNSYLKSGKGGEAKFTKNKGYFTNGDGVAYQWEESLSYY